MSFVVLWFSNAHCNSAPSIWMRLLPQAASGEVLRSVLLQPIAVNTDNKAAATRILLFIWCYAEPSASAVRAAANGAPIVTDVNGWPASAECCGCYDLSFPASFSFMRLEW